MPILSLSKEFTFEASHQLPNHDGKCRQLHGHSWKLIVEVTGYVQASLPVDGRQPYPKEGMVWDYSDIKRIVQPIVDQLDHHHLGSGRIYNFRAKVQPDYQKFVSDLFIYPDEHLQQLDFPTVPTSENILIWIGNQLGSKLPWTALHLNETCTSRASLYRNQEAQWIPNQ